ncbi:TPA: hypothetical protein N0F65_003975, partial [Lagenidium giganteum]
MIYQATALRPLRFATAPQHPPTWISCIVRVCRESWKSWLLWSAAIVGCSYGIAHTGIWYICKAKAHLYVVLVGFHMVTASTDLAVRTIFQRDTVQGQAIGHINTQPFIVRLVRVQLRRPHVFIALLLGTCYLHLASRLIISPSYLFPFSACSIGLKVGLQEFAKRFVLRHSGVKSRAVFLMVMLPTILIDTQLRVALLRFQSVSGSFASATIAVYAALVVAKGVVRLAKVALVRRDLLRYHVQQQSSISRSTSTGRSFKGKGNNSPRSANVQRAWRLSTTSSNTVTTYTHDLSLWKDRRLLFHAAEILADMHAEYIAIACALSVYLTYGGHPKYSLPVVSFSWSTISGTDASGVAQLSATALVAQLMLQVALDLVCCIAEVVNDIPLSKSTMPSSVVVVIIH